MLHNSTVTSAIKPADTDDGKKLQPHSLLFLGFLCLLDTIPEPLGVLLKTPVFTLYLIAEEVEDEAHAAYVPDLQPQNPQGDQ